MILGLYPATQSSTPRMLCSAGTSRLVPLRFKSIQKLAWFAGIAASAAGAEPIYHSTYTGKPPDEPAMLGLAMNELFVPLAHRARSAVAPAARPGRRVRGSCGTRPLRPPASLLHNAALPSVPASRCAKAPLGAGHRFAPCRVKATHVMQSGRRRAAGARPHVPGQCAVAQALGSTLRAPPLRGCARPGRQDRAGRPDGS